MDWLTFLKTMENTLNLIEVKGEDNLSALLGAISATKNMSASLLDLRNGNKHKSDNTNDENIEEGGEEDG